MLLPLETLLPLSRAAVLDKLGILLLAAEWSLLPCRLTIWDIHGRALVLCAQPHFWALPGFAPCVPEMFPELCSPPQAVVHHQAFDHEDPSVSLPALPCPFLSPVW